MCSVRCPYHNIPGTECFGQVVCPLVPRLKHCAAPRVAGQRLSSVQRAECLIDPVNRQKLLLMWSDRSPYISTALRRDDSIMVTWKYTVASDSDAQPLSYLVSICHQTSRGRQCAKLMSNSATQLARSLKTATLVGAQTPRHWRASVAAESRIRIRTKATGSSIISSCIARQVLKA